MKKKVIALMLVIPLLMMITIFTVSHTASLTADVPASGIELTSQNTEGAMTFDMATYQNDYYFEAEVLPHEAKNRDYNVVIEGDECVSVAEDGRLTLLRPGQATIKAVSNDKGYSTSLDVSVYSSKIYDMNILAKSEGGDAIAVDRVEGEAYDYEVAACSTGSRIFFINSALPTTVSGEGVEWLSSNAHGLLIDKYTGVAECLVSGEYIVSATTHSAIKGDLTKKVKVTLTMPESASHITLNGANLNDTAVLQVAPGASEARFIIESEAALFKQDIEGEGISVTTFARVNIEGASTYVYEIAVAFDAMIDGDARTFTIGEFGASSRLNVDMRCAEYVVNIASPMHTINSGDIVYQKKGMTVTYSPLITPYAATAQHRWSVDGDNVTLVEKDGALEIVANKVGSCTLTLESTIFGKTTSVSATLEVVEHSIAPTFKNRKNNGIKGINAIGDTAIEGANYVAHQSAVALACTIDGVIANANIADFVLSSSDESIVKVGADGTLDIVGTGIVDIVADWRYNEYFGENISTSMRANIVKDGVIVSTSYDLLKATEDARKVILASDIAFAKDMTDTEIRALLAAHQLPTTYDWQYYANLDMAKGGTGKDARPSVAYILEFKNDVYGNGYAINTEAIAKAYDGNNPKYFKGPLDFVAMEMKARVKGQDNISFLVREQGVTIDNISLKACDDRRLIRENADGAYLELSELNYVGTVLEIAGQGVSLINSRVSNGRNVVRAYGGGVDANGSPIIERRLSYDEVKAERIDVRIEACILSHAREFILKMGSNRAVLSKGMVDVNLFKPAILTDSKGKEYEYNDKTYDASDREFYDNNVLADITLKDSVLDTSGLFAIGVETHFSGYFLTGEGKVKDLDATDALHRYSWHDLAATSYATLLRLEGDVRIYDWKDIARVDSSTLIESNGETGDTLSKIINLDIGKMIKVVQSSGYERYDNILSNIDGKEYVHGGIAFYGGGKNYSKIDMSAFEGEAFGSYAVNISILAEGESDTTGPNYIQGSFLPLAAGAEDFQFYLYNSDSNFDYQRQQQDIADGDAYSWIEGAER